jgi:superfamily II DNA or RNA helicase
MEELWGLENENDDSQRAGHTEAITKFRLWMDRGCNGLAFAIYMCCRYGKSDTIRNLALLAIAAGKASAALVVHPSPDLADQFLEESRLKSWRQRWLPVGPRLGKIQVLPDFAHQSMCDGQWIGSIHIQALMQPMQIALLVAWVERCKTKTGLPPIIFFDEAHQFSSGNKWGDVARRLQAAGCIVVVLTATPFRNDGEDIFGFRKKPVGGTESREIKYVQHYAADETKLELHTVTRDETEYVLEADVEVPFAQGWAEGHIAKATFDLIEWNMQGWGKREGDERLLSEIPKDDARSILQSLYRDPAAIAEATRRVVGHLEKFRKHVPDASAVWYGMNDDSSGDVASENQKAIRDAIKLAIPSASIGIATQSSDEESDEKSREVIRKFCDTRKKGHDFLVLKQMGASGLDSDRICIVVLWNTVRSLGQMIQMAMRGGNVNGKTHFVIVGLKDSITVGKLQAFVKGEGGQYVDAVETDHGVELIDKKSLPDAGYVAVDVANVGMSDSDGNVASFDDVRLALHVISMWPSLIASDTIPQIAAKAKALGLPMPIGADDVLFVDTTKDCETYRDNLNEWVKRIGRRMFRKQYGRVGNGSREDNAAHGQFYRNVAGQIKARAGVSGTWDANSKQRSQSGSDYRKWFASAEAIWMEVSREEAS